MRMAVACGSGVVAFAWLVACVGDTPTTTPTDGDSGTGSSSGAASSSGSSGGACVMPADSASSKIACGAATCDGECCFDAKSQGTCDGSCSGVNERRSLKCESKYQCTGQGEQCCLALVSGRTPNAAVCPATIAFVDLAESACIGGGCDTSAGSGQYVMCRTDQECAGVPSTKCLPIAIKTDSLTLTYGICR